MPAPSISVVIPTRMRNCDLELCLEAVRRQQWIASEVIVVDSAPRDDSARAVAERFAARYVAEPRLGAARARNRGMQAATGDIVAFTDDDAVPEPGWLSALAPEFADPRVALVAGQVLPPQSLEAGLDALYRLSGFDGLPTARIVLDADSPGWFTQISFLPFGIAPNLAIRRSVLQRWAGFDARLGPGTPVPGHEEQRAFHELIELGYRLVYQPASRVVHPSTPRSAAELQRRSLLRMQATSAYALLLLCEAPGHRREVLAYFTGKLHASPDSQGAAAPLARWRRWAARLSGLFLYVRSRSLNRD